MKILIRNIKHFFQRKTRGFDDSDTWCLTTTTLEFMLPRLKVYREKVEDFPQVPAFYEEKYPNKSFEVYLSHLDELIWFTEYFVEEGGWPTQVTKERFENGMEIFHRLFFTLWW